MVATVKGRLNWTASRDKEGHREYRLTSLVKSDVLDGPAQAMVAGGLPAIGSPWVFGNDFDFYAFCYPTIRINTVVSREPNKYWEVENLFSTKPLTRCQDTTIDDPLLEPQKVSGNFLRYTKEAQQDRNGDYITSSSHELITGVEVDANRPTVTIEQNVASLGLDVFSQMVDTVNDAPLWGLPARTIKLGNVSWARNLFGSCNFYYTRTFEFEVNFNTFDIDDAIDKGFKVLDGYWDENGNWSVKGGVSAANPEDFIVFKDRNDENLPEAVPLDGIGFILTNPAAPVYLPTIELYTESNFLTLGIPTTF